MEETSSSRAATDFFVGMRISVVGDTTSSSSSSNEKSFYGTVRYVGPLLLERESSNNNNPAAPSSTADNDLWLGVEWDSDARGKHDGSVKGLLHNFIC